MKKILSKLMHLSIAMVLAFMLSISGLYPATIHKALADSADPIVASSTGSYVVNGDGTVTLTVHGQWQWTTHSSDCNLDRFGVGSAVDWNDASQAGNVIGNVNGTDIDVGAAAGNSRNPADNSVHYLANPAGTINPATGLPYPGITYCGTYSNPPNYNTGPWGPLSHTYPAGTTSFSACVVTFDIHANEGNGDFPRTPKASHLVATSNNDNSVEANKNTPLGNGCFAVSLPPTLKLVKNVTNDNGGAKTPHDWTLSATGSGGFSDFGDSTTLHTVNAGVGYALSESSVAGYAPGSWSCDGGSFAGSTVTLSAGQNVTCSITNNDIAPSLTVVKNVTNNNGGTKTADTFPVKVNGTILSGGSFSNSNLTDTYTYPNALANTPYTVSEDSPSASGYSQVGTVACTDNSTHAAIANPVTLANGQGVTCVISNDDIAPSLTLNKIVSNTHGGNATESQWTIKSTGTGQAPTNLSGPGVANNNADVVSGPTFKADTYTLSETGGPNGYSASNWTCTNGVTVTNSQITLANGQTTVCSITNSDIAPSLTVTKLVINNHGGSLDASKFPLFVTGTSGTTQVTSDQTYTAFKADNYNISETQQSGYHFKNVSGDCTYNAQTGGITLTLSLGGTYTCTLINEDTAPNLTLVKHVINDNSGKSDASAWTLSAAGSGGFSGKGTPATGDTASISHDVTAGTQYALSESGPSGYAASDWNCTGGGTFASPDKITLALGENVTCTITNNDIPNPGIHIVKSGPAVAHEGDLVTYTYAVTNTGDTDLSNVTVDDNIAGQAVYQSGDTNNDHILPKTKTETWIFTKTYTVPTPQVPDVVNIGTACGDYSDGTTSGNKCSEDTHTLDIIHPAINVKKSGPDTAFAGDTVTYTFKVTNPGDTPLSINKVNDNVAGDGVYVSGDTHNIGFLDTDETWTYTKQFTIPSNQTSDIINTVTACGSDSLQLQVCNTDDHTTTVLNPGIHVVKSGPSSAAAGATVTYTFTVTNDGNIPLSGVTVNDNIAGTGIYQSGDTHNIGFLDTDENWIYTKQYTIPAGQTASINNTVTACGMSDRELESEFDNIDGGISEKVCDTDTHTLTIPQVLGATVLVNTGESNTVLITAIATLNTLLVLGAVGYSRRSN